VSRRAEDQNVVPFRSNSVEREQIDDPIVPIDSKISISRATGRKPTLITPQIDHVRFVCYVWQQGEEGGVEGKRAGKVTNVYHFRSMQVQI